ASDLAPWVDVACVPLSGVGAIEHVQPVEALRPYLGVELSVGGLAFPTLANALPKQERLSPRRLQRLLKSENFRLVRDLTLYPPAVDADFPRLLAAADASGLRRLTVGAALSDADAGFLARAALTGLSALNVAKTGLTAGGMRLLATSPHLTNLTALCAYRNPLGCDGLVALAEGPLAVRLNALEVQNTQCGPRGAAALAGSPLMTRLYGPSLNLSMNPLGPAGARALAGCEYLERFTELVLRDCGVQTAGALALARSPHLANLKYLDLWRNHVGAAGVEALAESPYLSEVRVLGLTDNGLLPSAADRLRATFGDRLKV
ncbi:MAG: hypothetical protein K2V38_03470, partial [Gemmataceae bacterium]|nr:hypothetical protein [Gemmataceae bacterium]